MADWRDSEIPLPKNWPRRLRSAVIHTISIARVSLTATRSRAANSLNARIRLKAENGRLRQEIALLQEESQIKDARMERIPAHRRPHYPLVERLAILELRAARGWSLVQIPQPVNKFPAFVAYLVRRLKVLCPTMGKTKIAQVLCRAGLRLGATTVRRMLVEGPTKESIPVALTSGRAVTAKRPNHVWHVDLTTVASVHLLRTSSRIEASSSRRAPSGVGAGGGASAIGSVPSASTAAPPSSSG